MVGSWTCLSDAAGVHRPPSVVHPLHPWERAVERTRWSSEAEREHLKLGLVQRTTARLATITKAIDTEDHRPAKFPGNGTAMRLPRG